MDNEKNQKKDYVAPEMMEVEMLHMATLMCDSGDPTDPACAEDIPFNQVPVSRWAYGVFK